MLDVQNRFGDNLHATFQQQVIHAYHRTSQRIFYWRKESVSNPFRNCPKGRIKGVAGNDRDGFSKQLNRSSFAKSAWFSLKRDAQPLPVTIHFVCSMARTRTISTPAPLRRRSV